LISSLRLFVMNVDFIDQKLTWAQPDEKRRKSIMKNVIKSIAVIGMILSILPVNGIYTCTANATEAVVSVSENAVDVKSLAGSWKYQTSEKDNGTVVIKADGTYTCTDANGAVTYGTVRTGTEEIGGTVHRTVSFFCGYEFAFGGYYDDAQPGIISLGNGGISSLVRIADVKELAGSWKYQISEKDNGTVEIKADGTYACTDANGAVTSGTVMTGTEEIGGTVLRTVSFYCGSEFAFGGYYDDAQPGIISLGNGGISSLVRIADVKELAGSWKYQISEKDNGTVEIKADGTYTCTDANGAVTSGTVRTGTEEIGGTVHRTVSFFCGSEFAFGGYYDDAQPGIISLGNGGISSLVRSAAPVSALSGDANLDGRVNVADSVTTLQYVTNREKYPLSQQAAANADCDGVNGITGGDAIHIQQIDAGIIW